MERSGSEYNLITRNCLQQTLEAFMASDQRFKFVSYGLVNGVVPNEAVRRVAMIPSQKEKTPWKLIIISMFRYSKTDSAAASISLRTRKPISGGRSEPPIAVEGKAFSSQQQRSGWSSWQSWSCCSRVIIREKGERNKRLPMQVNAIVHLLQVHPEKAIRSNNIWAGICAMIGALQIKWIIYFGQDW